MGKTRRSALTAAKFALAASLGYACGLGQGGRVAGADSNTYLPIDQLARVLVLVENSYVDPAAREKLLDGAIRGMVAELDPHSSYMNPEEFEQFRSDTEGRFGGIGVEVDLRDELLTVIAPIEGSPAQRGGVRSGDRILAVDGKPLRGARIDRIVTLLRGEPGTKVRVTLGRNGVEEPIVLELVREVVRVASVEGKRLDGGVDYIRLKQFQDASHSELEQAIGKLRAGGSAPTGLILDMRYNPGGLVDQAELIADEFLKSGVIYTTRHRGEIYEKVEASRGGTLEDVPMIIMVNEYSASAAELVAGALQDGGRSQVLGAPTFGKGSVQTIFELPGGAGLRLTTMRYYTPNGEAIQAQGIAPDIWIKPAKTHEVIRESDLEGHLAAEQQRKTRPGQTVINAPPSVGEQGPTRVADLPMNPEKGSDFELAEAYRQLRKAAAR